MPGGDVLSRVVFVPLPRAEVLPRVRLERRPRRGLVVGEVDQLVHGGSVLSYRVQTRVVCGQADDEEVATMPILEPIPTDELSPVSRMVIEGGCEEGLYATPIPLQIFAYHTRQLLAMDETRRLRGDGSLLGGRILELIRIRSAQLGECQPCMQSRKHDSITDEDVACLLDASASELTDQERMAVDVPRPAVGRPPRDRRRLLPRLARGVHRRADRGARLHVRQIDGSAPLHPHARGLRHRRAGDPVLARPGRRPARGGRRCPDRHKAVPVSA